MDENETLPQETTEETTEDIKEAIDDISEDIQSETAQSDSRILDKLEMIHVELVRMNERHVSPTIEHTAEKTADSIQPTVDASKEVPGAVELTLDTPHDIPTEKTKKKRKSAFRSKK